MVRQFVRQSLAIVLIVFNEEDADRIRLASELHRSGRGQAFANRPTSVRHWKAPLLAVRILRIGNCGRALSIVPSRKRRLSWSVTSSSHRRVRILARADGSTTGRWRHFQGRSTSHAGARVSTRAAHRLFQRDSPHWSLPKSHTAPDAHGQRYPYR